MGKEDEKKNDETDRVKGEEQAGDTSLGWMVRLPCASMGQVRGFSLEKEWVIHVYSKEGNLQRSHGNPNENIYRISEKTEKLPGHNCGENVLHSFTCQPSTECSINDGGDVIGHPRKLVHTLNICCCMHGTCCCMTYGIFLLIKFLDVNVK